MNWFYCLYFVYDQVTKIKIKSLRTAVYGNDTSKKKKKENKLIVKCYTSWCKTISEDHSST